MTVLVPDTSNTIVIIPARMASNRLPGKPLADICGLTMIQQVMKRGLEADVGTVLVAAAEDEIANNVRLAGGDAILTDAKLPSGSDRVAQALAMRDVERRYEFVVNLQGDLPTIDPDAIRTCLGIFKNFDVDITTLVANITDVDEVNNSNIVKAIASFSVGATSGIATDFVRELQPGAAPPYWHHIGIYCYRRTALEKFVSLPISQNERHRSLEQMRALDNGMKIAVAQVDVVPFGVDTSEDLERARAALSS